MWTVHQRFCFCFAAVQTRVSYAGQHCNFTQLEGNYKDVKGHPLQVTTQSWRMLHTDWQCIRRDDVRLALK